MRPSTGSSSISFSRNFRRSDRVKDLLAAERYARALFEIARSLHRDEEIEAELENISSALKKDLSLERFFSNPSLKTEDKRKFLQKLYQEGREEYVETLLDFFTILFEKDRFTLIHEISKNFKRIADEAQGQGTAEIRSAVPLKSDQEAVLVNRLETIAGCKITIKKEVDPALLGGIVVRIKNKIIDGSVKFKIESLKKELTSIHE